MASGLVKRIIFWGPREDFSLRDFQIVLEVGITLQRGILTGAADPNRLDADPDPTFQFYAIFNTGFGFSFSL